MTVSSIKEIKNSLKEYDYIKFAAYRTSAKLRLLQKTLLMDRLSLNVIASIFEKHQLQQTENSMNLNKRELESLLADIYFLIDKQVNFAVNVDSLCQLMVTLLLDIYDMRNSNGILVLSCKVFLTMICQAKPREKYLYLFHQLANWKKCLPRNNLQALLTNLICVIEYIGEGFTFGSELIAGTIASCFNCIGDKTEISEANFLTWLMQDPQLLVWLSTLYRIQISELASHNVKCVICKSFPIVGLRYRCLRCLSYDMCQNCFFSGKHNRRHKLKHPIHEYCYPMTTQQLTKAFLLTIRNILYKKQSKLQYLPVVKKESLENPGPTNCPDSKTDTNNLSLNKSVLDEFHNIILEIEKESKKIIPQLDRLFTNLENVEGYDAKAELKLCLTRHKAQIEEQVKCLKQLKNCFLQSDNIGVRKFSASTPMINGNVLKIVKKDFAAGLATFSPIKVFNSNEHTPTRHGQLSEKKLLWDNYDLVNCSKQVSWEEVESRSQNVWAESKKENFLSDSDSNEKERDEVFLSRRLAGTTIDESDTSLKRGFTWIYDNDDVSRKEIKDDFQEVEMKLGKILNELNDWPEKEISPELSTDEENCYRGGAEDVSAADRIDSLLLQLVNTTDKLISEWKGV